MTPSAVSRPVATTVSASFRRTVMTTPRPTGTSTDPPWGTMAAAPCPPSRAWTAGVPAASRGGLAQLVARTAHGEDQLRPHRVGLELVAQAVDVGGDGVFVAVVAVAPDGVEQLRAREHVARVRREVQQQVELQRGELDRLAAVAHQIGRAH